MRTRLSVNLMTVFVTLMSERSVSRTAKQLNLNQPTVSKQLNVLRTIFRDPLFIRSGSEMVATHRGREIGDQLTHVLSLLDVLDRDTTDFDPSTSKSHFVIATSDYGSYVVVPYLISFLQSKAPNITITTKAFSSKTAEDILIAGEADLCLASDPAYSYPIIKNKLFDDEYVCLCREGHAVQEMGLDAERFLQLGHLAVPRQSGGSSGVVESALAQRNMSRSIAMSVTSLLTVPHVLGTTDLILTTTRRIAERLCASTPLRVYEHPLELKKFSFYQLWHERNSASAGHKWLRDVISDGVVPSIGAADSR